MTDPAEVPLPDNMQSSCYGRVAELFQKLIRAQRVAPGAVEFSDRFREAEVAGTAWGTIGFVSARNDRPQHFVLIIRLNKSSTLTIVVVEKRHPILGGITARTASSVDRFLLAVKVNEFSLEVLGFAPTANGQWYHRNYLTPYQGR